MLFKYRWVQILTGHYFWREGEVLIFFFKGFNSESQTVLIKLKCIEFSLYEVNVMRLD